MRLITARRIELDYLPRRASLTTSGLLLLALGIAVAFAVSYSFDRIVAQRDHLQERVDAASKVQAKTKANLPTAADDASKIEWELAVPWSELLSELEDAGHDSNGTVALLSIEPDPGKRTVHIGAEVRSLRKALEFVERLQSSPLLRNPMLESHDLNKTDPEHPYRIKIIAEWRT